MDSEETGAETLDAIRLRRLLQVGRTLVADLDIDIVLQNVLEAARDLTGARYAALGVLNSERDGLERFLTLGIDEETHRRIGDLPRGHGVLGVLIKEPRPLRLNDVGDHPRSYGFPPGHPPMKTFLGVPVRIREEVYGNLYLTEKDGGRFDQADEEAVVILAEWAGFAIQNARLYQDATGRRDELQRAVSAFEGSLAVARAVGAETNLDRILELIVKRGRALVNARSMFIALDHGGELRVSAVAGELDRSHEHETIDTAASPAAEALRRRRPLHLGGDPDGGSCYPLEGVRARAALLVPLVYRGEPVGVLGAIDPMDDAPRFTSDAERVLEAFASSGATAVATGRNVAEERMRRGIEASESERRRWARELHDETLQDMASLKLILSSARRSSDPEAVRAVLDQAIEQITSGITALRHLINDLRPPLLDEAGLQPALEALIGRVEGLNGLTVHAEISLDYESGAQPDRIRRDLEDAVYRIVQEGLTNVVKHADASMVHVSVVEEDDQLRIRVVDDGVGVRPVDGGSGFGLIGMRERVELVGGFLEVAPGESGGTEIRADLPTARSASPAEAG
jgi:signal transduction histidine kinase